MPYEKNPFGSNDSETLILANALARKVEEAKTVWKRSKLLNQEVQNRYHGQIDSISREKRSAYMEAHMNIKDNHEIET